MKRFLLSTKCVNPWTSIVIQNIPFFVTCALYSIYIHTHTHTIILCVTLPIWLGRLFWQAAINKSKKKKKLSSRIKVLKFSKDGPQQFSFLLYISSIHSYWLHIVPMCAKIYNVLYYMFCIFSPLFFYYFNSFSVTGQDKKIKKANNPFSQNVENLWTLISFQLLLPVGPQKLSLFN